MNICVRDVWVNGDKSIIGGLEKDGRKIVYVRKKKEKTGY